MGAKLRKKSVEFYRVENPFIYWRNEWREAKEAIIFPDRNEAYVRVTDGSVTLMTASSVLKTEEDVLERKKKYKEGWIVDRSGEIYPVELHFGNCRYFQERRKGFYFEQTSPGNFIGYKHQWAFEHVDDSSYSSKWFPTEEKAMRMALRIVRAELKRSREDLKPTQKREAELKLKLKELKK